ncbi:MAG: Trk family potassium uptake protein, partial [Clostridia bacterium]|nr:Trk family potassium uptake protein [Clostridia bacterium]
MRNFKKPKLSVWQFLALGYFAVIAVGSLLLALPISSKSGEFTDYIDALFTATSATCVTGLIPVDTGTHWSLFGQIVILLLIQTGGLGFMTFVTVLFRLVGKNMGLHEKKILMLSAGEEDRVDLRRLFKRLLIGTAIIELAGALLLCIRFIPDFGAGKGIYFSVFHSVSAFCNAGFDLMGGVFGGETFASLTHYANDPIVVLTVSSLIVIGGLGYCVWDDVIESKFNWKKYRLHT